MAANKKNSDKEFIIKNLDELSGDYIDIIKKKIKAEITKQKRREKEIASKSVIHKNTDTFQYRLLVKLLNGILVNMKMKKIKFANEFKNINRLNIIDPGVKPIFDAMRDDIFKNFNKLKCGFYYLESPSAVLNCIRGMCKTLNIILEWKKYEKRANSVTHTDIIYSII